MVHFLRAETTLIGSNKAWPLLGKHDCSIKSEMDHGMHQQNPNASCFQRFLRVCRKLTLPTYAHRFCKIYYPTRPKIIKAWMQVSSTRNPCIVHPFSTLSLIWQTLILIIWIFLSVARPYLFAFVDANEQLQDDTNSILIYLTMGCSFVLGVNILMNFITGYRHFDGKGGIVMKFSAICKNYLLSYFIIDLIDALPLTFLVYITKNLSKWWMLLHIFGQFTRACTLVEYLFDFTHLLRINKNYVVISCFGYFLIVILNWFTCILIELPNFMTPNVSQTKPTGWNQYVIVLNKVTSHFFLGSCPIQYDELIPVIILMLVGFAFRLIAICCLFSQLVTYDKTKTRYHALVLATEQYMRSHKVSWNLQQRISLFFKHKYQGKFCNEKLLKRTLSEHLQHEMHLHYCGHLICTMQLCQYLPRETIGEILMTLEPAFYHSSDVIISVNDPTECLFMISHGSIAAYTAAGVEMQHYEDGQFVGLLSFYKGKQIWTMVAIEPTELFIWYRKDVQDLSRRHPQIAQQLSIAYDRHYERFLKIYQERNHGRFDTSNAEFYKELINESILERRIPRTPRDARGEQNESQIAGCTNDLFNELMRPTEVEFGHQ